MASKVSLFLLVCICLLYSTEGGWFRRRRHSSCRNCSWGPWGHWGACSSRCGSTGTQTRTRSVAVHGTCGRTCSGPSTQTKACNRFCYNGGFPVPRCCHCQHPFYGTCCEYGRRTPRPCSWWGCRGFKAAADTDSAPAKASDCTDGKIWKDCGTACPLKCGEDQGACTKECVKGCFCPENLPRLDGEMCVAEKDCTAE